MPGDKVVDLTTFALHTLAGGFKIKIAGSQDDVGENFEKLNHGRVPRHGHHGVKHIAGFGCSKVRSRIVNLDFTGGRRVLICHA